eukprot:c15775_g1_i1.p1 GENE.c15775_g1_i1~~c15775_g1_i1.p1  ORF type:complete len:107 (-),score=11.49 c15775_g1_i1:124-444(-)
MPASKVLRALTEIKLLVSAATNENLNEPVFRADCLDASHHRLGRMLEIQWKISQETESFDDRTLTIVSTQQSKKRNEQTGIAPMQNRILIHKGSQVSRAWKIFRRE